MLRTFDHSFVPVTANPVQGTVASLTVTEIEDAGVREILQTPGPALASWSMIDALLEPSGPGTPFVFREPIGHAREVKVALSGLFGRFVARAYLEKYLGLSVFAHLGLGRISLNARRRIFVARRLRGDLPDWVACTSALSKLTVAEAKGCHDRPGPAKALTRAWDKTGRVSITCKGLPVTVKRVAIATRWACTRGGASNPMIAVHDPDELGVPPSDDDNRAMFVGLLRRHVASLLHSLGHEALAAALVRLGSTRRAESRLAEIARGALDAAPVSEVNVGTDDDAVDGLVGGVVTRMGRISNTRLSATDEEALARLSLRPLFVGLEVTIVRAAIDGEAEVIRSLLSGVRRRRERARTDGAGGWIVPLGRERANSES